MRPSGRAPDQMRAITIEPNFTRHAEGSVLVGFGDTKVLVTASVEERVPPFLRGKGEGWVTAEYGMLPRATHTRGSREAAKGKQSGRTQEIQRLIGRSLRAVTDMKLLGERQIVLDCDVIQADGGTRTASISGAWVALRLAIDGLLRDGKLTADPLQQKVAAVSLPALINPSTARRSATQAPEIDAVRVPPSAWITSQSSTIWRSPSAFRSVTARSERPISRWISCVRPDCLPLAATR